MKSFLAKRLMTLMQTRQWDVWGFTERMERLGARHSVPSALLSLDDQPGKPSDEILDLVLEAVARTRQTRFPAELQIGRPAFPTFFNDWPGEPYRLLAALVQVLQAKHVIEIGTFTGLSFLSLKQFLPPDGTLTTFDVIPWHDTRGTYLLSDDFMDERCRQEIADLSLPEIVESHAVELRKADLVFVDAAKDGIQERQFLNNFTRIGLNPGTCLVFDDIRLLTMLSIWREISHP